MSVETSIFNGNPGNPDSLPGPLIFRDFRETGPWGPFLESPDN